MSNRTTIVKSRSTTTPKPKEDDGLHKDCDHYILGAIALSVLCNGYAGFHHGMRSGWFAAVLGALLMGVIPLGLLKASQVFGKLSRRPKGEARKAIVIATVGIFGLILSLIHVAEVIGQLMGASHWTHYILPAFLAIFIDAMLVSMEWVKTTTK